MSELPQNSAPPLTSDPHAPLRIDVGTRWMAAMRAGDYEAAWRQTDRLELPRRAQAAAGVLLWQKHHLVWDGTPWAGREVLICCEHGLGDTLQYLRYCPLLRQTASRVTLRVQPALLELCHGLAGVDALVDAWTAEPDPPHDVKIECMELAYAFRHTTGTLPQVVPYLPVPRLRQAGPELLAKGGAGLQVGLIWAASAWNPARSLPLAELAPLADLPGATFYSLQQGPERAEAGQAPLPLVPLSAETAEVAQAAAAMLALDLILTVDSMTAHLAGALGRSVWLLLTHEADWRWQSTGERSPWYPTMRIFRQPSPGDWAGVMDQVRAALAKEPADLRRLTAFGESTAD